MPLVDDEAEVAGYRVCPIGSFKPHIYSMLIGQLSGYIIGYIIFFLHHCYVEIFCLLSIYFSLQHNQEELLLRLITVDFMVIYRHKHVFSNLFKVDNVGINGFYCNK